MPSFVRDVIIKNVVLDDDAIQELHKIVLQRVTVHNTSVQDSVRQLTPVYVVRFDNCGYRTLSADEAWDCYKSASTVERVVLQAESALGLRTNHMLGEQVEIRLDTDDSASSHLFIGGDSRDWVETTFAALEGVLIRRKSKTTAVIRTQWMVLALQLVGVFAGLLLCLWLASLTAAYLKDVEYPRALAFAFWFLVYNNLWAYIQRQALAELSKLFPNVRFARKGEHWAQALVRKGVEAAGVGVALWALAWLTKWAASVIAPFVSISP